MPLNWNTKVTNFLPKQQGGKGETKTGYIVF
jgi:hypothetical protein